MSKPINIDSLKQYSDSLQSVLNNILHHKQEIQNDHNYWLGGILLFVTTIVSILVYYYWRKEKQTNTKNNKENRQNGDVGSETDEELTASLRKRNRNWVLIWFVLLALYFWSFFELGLIHADSFWFSHGDALLVIATIIAIIGAYWAVLARIDAERAFQEAVKAKDEAMKSFGEAIKAREASEKTLNALGTSFTFDKILDFENIPSLLKSPLEDNTSTSLFLGVPCIGYLYKEKGKFKTKPEEVFWLLTNFLRKLNKRLYAGTIRGIVFNISVFPKSDTEKILDTVCSVCEIEYGGDPNLLLTFYKELEVLKNYANTLMKTDNNRNQVIVNDTMPITEKLRFITFKHENNQGPKAYVWVVDFTKSSTTGESFDSATFQTNDGKFIEVLDKVFD